MKNKFLSMILILAMVVPSMTGGTAYASDVSDVIVGSESTDVALSENTTSGVSDLSTDGDTSTSVGNSETVTSSSDSSGTDWLNTISSGQSDSSAAQNTDVSDVFSETEKNTNQLPTDGSVLLADMSVTEDIDADFSSRRLLVQTPDAGIFTEDTHVLAKYEDVYLVEMDTAELAETGYAYYGNVAEKVEIDSIYTIYDKNKRSESGEEMLTGLSGITDSDNPFVRVESLKAYDVKRKEDERIRIEQGGEPDYVPEYLVALIDTGEMMLKTITVMVQKWLLC